MEREGNGELVRVNGKLVPFTDKNLKKLVWVKEIVKEEKEGLSITRHDIDRYNIEDKENWLNTIRKSGVIVKKTRKTHRCFYCSEIILIGSKCLGGVSEWELRLCEKCMKKHQINVESERKEVKKGIETDKEVEERHIREYNSRYGWSIPDLMERYGKTLEEIKYILKAKASDRQ